MPHIDPTTRRPARRYRRPRQRHWAAGLVGVIAVLGSSAVPAAAIPLPRLRPPVIKQLPPVRHIEIPRPARAVPDEFGSGSRYGTDDPTTVRTLDEANAGLVDDVDRTAQRVSATAEARVRIKECVGGAVNEMGASYGEDVQDAANVGEPPPSPDFNELSAAVAGCLGKYFPNAPEDLFQLGAYLADRAAQHAQEVQSADSSGAVLAKWLTATGAEVPSGDRAGPVEAPVTGTSDPTEEPDAGSSFPWWALIVVALLAAGGVFFAVQAKRKP